MSIHSISSPSACRALGALRWVALAALVFALVPEAEAQRRGGHGPVQVRYVGPSGQTFWVQPYVAASRTLDDQQVAVAGVRAVGRQGTTGFGLRGYYERTLRGTGASQQAFGADVLAPVVGTRPLRLDAVLGAGYVDPLGEEAADGRAYGLVGLHLAYEVNRRLTLGGDLGARVTTEAGGGDLVARPAFSAGVGVRF